MGRRACLAVALLLSACGVTTTSLPASSTAPVGAGGHCVATGGLPDPSCTPGVIDPRVTQANISITICRAGYTATVRPPTSYTEPLKLAQMVAYGETGSPAGYEEDHLIPLELGGSSDPHNLWPQPRSGPQGAAVKDGVENTLRSEVCAGSRTLADAQHAIATDWEMA